MSIRSYQGKQPQIDAGVFVDPTAVVIGDVQLAEGVSIWPMAVVRGDMHFIRIGANTSVQDGAVLHITHASKFNPNGFPLQIGAEVTIGHKAILHGCTLGDRILVGMGAIIMDGAIIEDEVIIAAGALVPPGKKLASGYVYAGSPARQLRPLTPEELEFFSYSAANYVALQAKHREEIF